MAKYIFITGGVVSSLGKGLTSASLGRILISRGFKIRMVKVDPYLNVDPGTMSPYQHGEVYVTDDGAETDLDLGHYERFTGQPTTKKSNFTAGRIYWEVLRKERHRQGQEEHCHGDSPGGCGGRPEKAGAALSSEEECARGHGQGRNPDSRPVQADLGRQGERQETARVPRGASEVGAR